MAPGGPSNLRQKRNFVSRTSIKGLLHKEKNIGVQNGTTQNSNGGTNTLSNNQSTGCQTTQNLYSIEDNTLPNLASQTSDVTSPIPSMESIQHASSEDVAASAVGYKKRSRGQTTGKGILKYFNTFGKMKIDMDTSIGRPINAEESAKLASTIGLITRDVLHVPNKWKDVDEVHGLTPGFDHLQIHMDVNNIDNPDVKRSLIDMMRNSTRKKRFKLHKHFRKYATVQEAKNNKPSFCPNQDNWEQLCDYFATEKFKRVSEVNRSNRQKMQCKHISGRKAFTVRSHEISRQELAGAPCDRIDLYERTHSTVKDGWKSNEAKENWEMMKKKREEYTELGIEKTVDEIVLEVLGHGTGYVKGLGYGPKPPSRRSTFYDSSTQLRDELKDTKEKLKESEAQAQESKARVQELNTQVTVLQDELSSQSAKVSAQGATLAKLMAYLTEKGIEL